MTTRLHLSSRRRRTTAAVVSAAAIGAGLALAAGSTPAAASDMYGYGYAIPGPHGGLDLSHLGSYGPPGLPITGVTGLVYCANPLQSGPLTAGGYGPATAYTSWRTAGGTPVPGTDVDEAAYVLSQYGQTTSDSQAAEVDAAETSYLNPGGTYDLRTGGARAVQRLSYPNVPASVRTQARQIMATAAADAGPYAVTVHLQGTLAPGKRTYFTVTVTSHFGHKLPGTLIDLDAVSGPKSDTDTVTTNADGVATDWIQPVDTDPVTLTAKAVDLPATSLRAVIPHNPGAQRMVLAGGTSTAQTVLTIPNTSAPGTIHITKVAADTGRPLAGVQFAVKTAAGTTVAGGTTNSSGIWQAAHLPPGRYVIHEVRAAHGYELAADRTVTVTADQTVSLTIRDIRIPTVPPHHHPRPVTIHQLPQTGA